MILARGFLFFLGLFIFLASEGQNVAPSFNAFPKSKTASARVQACVSISTHDADATDTVRLSLISGSVTGQWATNSGSVKWADGEFCVTPTDQDAGSNWAFVFMAHDGIDSTIDTFYLNVLGLPGRHSFKEIELGCGKWRFAAEANTWTTKVDVKIQDLNSNGVYTKTFNDVDDLIGDTLELAAGEYVLRSEYWDTAPNLRYYVDTIQISRGIEVMVDGNNKVNQGDMVYLKGRILKGEAPIKTYWVVERNGIAQTMAEDTNYFSAQQFETSTYRYIAQGKDICLYEASITVETIESTSLERKLMDNLALYPNPAVNHTRIALPFDKGLIRIHDISGKVLMELEFRNQSTLELSLDQLVSGIYIVSLNNTQGQVWTGKLVKE